MPRRRSRARRSRESRARALSEEILREVRPSIAPSVRAACTIAAHRALADTRRPLVEAGVKRVIGTYPTPVTLLPALSSSSTQLWVKRDDLTSELYGGNKVRKLERIIEDAKRRGAKRLVTFGGAGSHHVLATTLYGVRAGFRVAAVLTPQHHTAHAEAALATALACGLEPWPAPATIAVPFVLAARIRRGDYIVDPGGSSLLGTLGYVDAAREVACQIADGAMPVPDLLVTALGSGGTVAGLLAGLACDRRLHTRVVAVRVVSPMLAGARRTIRLAERAARDLGQHLERGELEARLEVDGRYVGRGYGWPTPEGEAATHAAAQWGIALDPTYTAKAFAAALDVVRGGRVRTVLYWHTLSRATGRPQIIGSAASESGRLGVGDACPEGLRRLFR